MRVLFDLRPRHLVHIQEQQVDVIRLLSVLLFVAFVGLSLFNIGHIAYRLRNVRMALGATQNEQAVVAESVASLGARINQMRELRDRIRAYLEFTRQELPTVEFMSALEGAVTTGLKVSNLEIRQGSVTMRGSGLTDQDILDFVAKLDSMKNIVTRVDAPVTTRGTLGKAIITDFAISCNIKSISEVTVAVPEEPVINTQVEGAEGAGNTGQGEASQGQ